jgi:hypothetical protein
VPYAIAMSGLATFIEVLAATFSAEVGQFAQIEGIETVQGLRDFFLSAEAARARGPSVATAWEASYAWRAPDGNPYAAAAPVKQRPLLEAIWTRSNVEANYAWRAPDGNPYAAAAPGNQRQYGPVPDIRRVDRGEGPAVRGPRSRPEDPEQLEVMGSGPAARRTEDNPYAVDLEALVIGPRDWQRLQVEAQRRAFYEKAAKRAEWAFAEREARREGAALAQAKADARKQMEEDSKDSYSAKFKGMGGTTKGKGVGSGESEFEEQTAAEMLQQGTPTPAAGLGKEVKAAAGKHSFNAVEMGVDKTLPPASTAGPSSSCSEPQAPAALIDSNRTWRQNELWL